MKEPTTVGTKMVARNVHSDAFRKGGIEATRGGAQDLFLRPGIWLAKVPWSGGSGPVGRLPGLQSPVHMAGGFLNSTFQGQKGRHGGGAGQACWCQSGNTLWRGVGPWGPGMVGVGLREKSKKG